jgi:hypothetical protein
MFLRYDRRMGTTSRYRGLFAIAIALQLTAVCATTQVPGRLTSPMSFRALSADTRQVNADRLREMRIRWTTSPATPAGVAATGATTAPTQSFEVVRDQAGPGVLRRERQPQITANQLVIVVRRADGAALDWRAVQNPRIVRAEVPGADGQLTGRTVEREDSELLVTVPDLADAASLSVYQPRWNGTEYLLDLIGSVPLKRVG